MSMKYIFIGFGIVTTTALVFLMIDGVILTEKECPDYKVFNQLNYDGGSMNRCNSIENYKSKVYTICLRKMSKFARSMSDTWGNDEYNTVPVVDYTERFMEECVKELSYPITNK